MSLRRSLYGAWKESIRKKKYRKKRQNFSKEKMQEEEEEGEAVSQGEVSVVVMRMKDKATVMVS
ncbi:hypothetical protein E2C01_007263 [Portunus trituberculatus]|uniref:Uncharacterized protein n=1 Tax=Portunus trituberculatus TaxID=210409 RepID=A0A5B7D1Y7_PORTR|nr:hypothetical protein [Portunus trituberculatus]